VERNNIEKEQKNYYYDGITQILIIEFELVWDNSRKLRSDTGW
jgi:hypothetical protein